MRTRRTRAPALLTATAVLLASATAVILLHSQPHNGRRRAVTAAPATSRPPRNPARAAAHAPSAASIDLADLRWRSFYGIALPVSAADGPRDTRGGLASGYSDTPAGALLAAINIGVRTAAQWGPRIFQPTITSQVTGPDTPSLLAAQESATAEPEPAGMR
jgi:hypothetical protein